MQEKFDPEDSSAPTYGMHDSGPWTVSDDGRTISSDDFTHDVLLRVSGDFYNDAQRKCYADQLAKILNRGLGLNPPRGRTGP